MGHLCCVVAQNSARPVNAGQQRELSHQPDNQGSVFSRMLAYFERNSSGFAETIFAAAYGRHIYTGGRRF